MAHLVFVEDGRLIHRTFTEVMVVYPNGKVSRVEVGDVWITLVSGQTKRQLEWVYPIDRRTDPTDLTMRMWNFTQGAVAGAAALFVTLLLAGFAF